jgi:hypothetical protein
VLMTWAKLVALKSPVLELTVTSRRLMLARTEVNRTLQSLYRATPSPSINVIVIIPSKVDLPLLLDHFEEVAMIYYTLEYRCKGESVMATECSGESNNWNDMTQSGWLGRTIRISYVRIKMRQKAAVSGSKLLHSLPWNNTRQRTRERQHDVLRLQLWP